MKVLTLVRSITIGLVVFVGVTFADATNEEEEAVVVADFRSGIPRKLQEPLLSTCTQVGTEPYNTTVYTMVTYQGSNFDFNNIPTLQELEEAFQASYNSYDVCTDRYKNAYKSIGLTFVLSADLTKKQYVLGSRLMTNSNPSTCTGGAQVPKLYEARDRANTGPDVKPGEDCLCYGPHKESLIETYNNELQSSPGSMVKENQVVIGMEQLCVSANCASGTLDITFDSETGLVTLPCNELETPECTNSDEFNCSKFLKKKKKRGKKCGKFKNGEKIKDLCPEICKKNLCTCIDDFDKFTIKGKIGKKFTCAKVNKKNCKKKTGHGFIVRSICPNRCKNTKKCLN